MKHRVDPYDRLMCGIAGQVDLDGGAVDVHEVAVMVELLVHRGPDGGGVSVVSRNDGDAPTAVLGHRRLAVIDRSEAGAQPLTNEDSSVSVVFNGEIYGFSELRRTLEGRGHRFSSRTDTEVIVHAYEEFGDDVVRHLDGMFAFALWDAKRKRLLLARDRVGKKPLYYAQRGRRLAFASEIKALRACRWIDSGVAWDRVPELLAFGYVPWPTTLHAGIDQVPPATTAVADHSGFHVRTPYWEPPFARAIPRRSVSWDEAVGRVRERLRTAVQRRLVADVPVGVLLSGGIDSAAVVATMAGLGAPIRTFTVSVGDDPSYDEKRYARMVASHFGTDHTEVDVGADATALVERVLWHLDEPMADSSCLPTYLIAEEARRHVTVALTGDGGDEVFGGYDRFRALLAADRLPLLAQRPIRSLARLWPVKDAYDSPRRRLERFSADVARSPRDRYRGWVAVFGQELLGEVLAKRTAADEAYRSFEGAWGEGDGTPLLHRVMHANFRTYLHDDLLVKLDRMTMAHGLEARCPMLDVDLVEEVAALPPKMKADALRSKRVLRRALVGVVPDAVLHRPKHGFGVPVGNWFRGTLGGVFEDLVLSADARLGDALRPGAAGELFRLHRDRRGEHGGRLWALLALEVWLRSMESPLRRTPPKRSITVSSAVPLRPHP